MSDFRYVAKPRRTKEDRRFITGQGRFVADIKRRDMKHIALVTSPFPAAEIKSIDASDALALDGVHYVLTGQELEDATQSLMSGLDLPDYHRYPLASKVTRYAGEWVAAVVADSRYIAEDAAEMVWVDYEPLDFVVDPEDAIKPDAPVVHPEIGSNVFFHRTFEWGPVDDDFDSTEHSISYRARWSRNSTVPIETFGVVAEWHSADELLEVWASIQMPKYQEQIGNALKMQANNIRVHYDVDVGGSYGVKRGIKHSVLVGYLAMKLGFPVRLIEDRLENMIGGDAHGPDRIFDVEMAFDNDGIVKSMRMRALDDAGASPGRAPLQLGKPVTAIVGPYHIESVRYEAISVSTHKTTQEAVRGFGQSPTNFAIESGIDKIARFLEMDRFELRRKNLIRADEFPYEIPSGTSYDSGDFHTVLDKVEKLAGLDALLAKRDALREDGKLAGVGISTCLEPSGGNAGFEPLFNPKNPTTTWMESCQVKIDMNGTITGIMATTSSGQGHESLVATVVGEVLQRDPDTIRVARTDSISSLPSNSPVGSRMAIMLGGAAQGAAEKLKARLIEIAAHNLQLSADKLDYRDGDVVALDNPDNKIEWRELVEIAHRRYHDMPDGMEPGLQARHVWEVPTGGTMPTPEGKVQMYPCYSFEAHIPLVEVDPVTGQVTIHDYYIGHDCGTQINPHIVHGMTYGGIAHGIGAALYEKFQYNEDGQLL
ncbi:MAG TPA: xanthine dehydrogenase family protein molybdopterin-binding subunit, partial [Rhodospirillaceae bacterium]|nr:xanthine dehydrogenase family protein molybdopterin-binding subunit [Rhodospirillaceae bacterium]